MVKLLQKSITFPFIYDFLFSLDLRTGLFSIRTISGHHQFSPQTLQNRCKILLRVFQHVGSTCILEMSSLEPSFLLFQSGLVAPRPCFPVVILGPHSWSLEFPLPFFCVASIFQILCLPFPLLIPFRGVFVRSFRDCPWLSDRVRTSF